MPPVHPPPRHCRPLFRLAGIACLLGWMAGAPLAAAPPVTGFILPEPISPATAHSVSGQFIAHGKLAPTTTWGIVPDVGDNPLVDLHPELLAVTAERVKRAVLRQLDAPDRWEGKVHLYLQASRQPENQPIRIVPQLYRDGWYYWMVVPERLAWRRLVRALSEAVLLEIANRSSEAFVETPLWLNEGIAGLVIAENGRALVVERRTALQVNERREDPLRESRALLAGRDPWTFSDLGLPTAEELRDPEKWALFQGSAILLTHELLHMPGGRPALHEAIRMLPRHLNWHTAFLKAYSSQFASLLDVEKWWAVSASHVLARDPASQWPAAVALERLEAVVVEVIERRDADADRPVRRTLRLGELIAQTDYQVHGEILQRKVRQLHLLYAHAPADVLPLAVDYAEALERYLENRTPATATEGRGAPVFGRSRFLIRQTTSRLEALDQRLEQALSLLAPPRTAATR